MEAQATIRRDERGRYLPGETGNRFGTIRSKRFTDLFAVIAREFGGDAGLSPIEREYLVRAAEALRRADRAKDNDAHVRLTRLAAHLIGTVRDDRKPKPEKPGEALARYLATKNEAAS